MDPVTAIFNFLSTPAGQTIVLQADAGLTQVIKDLINVIHAKQTGGK